jgi:hypothetical protein
MASQFLACLPICLANAGLTQLACHPDNSHLSSLSWLIYLSRSLGACLISPACHLDGMEACHTSRHVYDLCCPVPLCPSISSACHLAGMDACDTSRHVYDLCCPEPGLALPSVQPVIFLALTHVSPPDMFMIFAVLSGLALPSVQPAILLAWTHVTPPDMWMIFAVHPCLALL